MLPLMNPEVVLPSRILFGSGVRERLSEVAPPLGQRAWFIFGSRRFHPSCGTTYASDAPTLWEELSQTLQTVGVESQYLTTISREPTIDDVDQTVKTLRSHLRPGDFLIAVGGGAAMDLAKATAALVVQAVSKSESVGEETFSVCDFLEGIGTGRKLVQMPLSVIAMPTTAGTGAEATKNAVITSHHPPCKKSLRHPAMLPKVVVVDPDLLATLPSAILAASGMDAITQLIESAISGRANQFCRSLATATLAPAVRALPILFHAATDMSNANPLDKTVAQHLRESREAMAYAALVSGISLANSGLGLAHGVAASLGVHAGVSHGVACAMLLPMALRINADVAAETIQQLEQSLLTPPTTVAHSGTQSFDADMVSKPDMASNGGTEANTDNISLEQRMIALNRMLGIPTTLSELGVTAAQIPEIARDSKGNSLSGNPRPISESELIDILTQML